MCRKPQHFFFQTLGGAVNGRSDVHSTAAAEGSAAESNRRSIAFDQTDIVRANPPEISGNLCENGFVTLAVAGRTGGDDHLARCIDPHLRAFELTSRGPL